MKTTPLTTNDPNLNLIEPVIERDARLGVQWLQGNLGRNTLQLMGVSNKENKPTTLDQERQRVAEFIKNRDQMNWMIEYNSRVVGSIWIDLEPKDSVPSPAIHIMIGDPNVRGQGIGYSATSKVIDFLKEQGNNRVYSRHLAKNNGARSLLEALGFKTLGDPYTDHDGLEWQNVKKQLTER